MHVAFKASNEDGLWYFTGIYASNNYRIRKVQWEVLEEIQLRNEEKWICGGDFNCVLNNDEKFGGNTLTQFTAEPLKKMITNCNLMDL